jgi:uncharacterized protein (DUF1684 family)
MKKIFLSSVLLLNLGFCFAQYTYKDSAEKFIRDYIDHHEVVKGEQRKQMQFFEIDPAYRVKAGFERKENQPWFLLPTSGKLKKSYRVYGTLSFRIHDSLMQLQVYQSQDLMQVETYKTYLFLPFTDATTGEETYESGRYIDLTIEDIKEKEVIIDFNKAYNPYCAYVSGIYNCPIPPRENHLPIAIRAGEKRFGKH